MEENEEEQRTNLNWRPMFGAFEEAFEWALNTAAQFAREYPDEVAAVERVRSFLRRRFAQLEIERVSLDDVMFTFALVMGAVARNTYEGLEARIRAAD
jgi:hypothetical protein